MTPPPMEPDVQAAYDRVREEFEIVARLARHGPLPPDLDSAMLNVDRLVQAVGARAAEWRST